MTANIPPETLQKLLLLLASVSVAAVMAAAIGWNSKSKAASGSETDDDDHLVIPDSPVLKLLRDSPKNSKKESKKSTASSMLRSLSVESARGNQEEYGVVKHVRVYELPMSSGPTADCVEEGGLQSDPAVGFEPSGSGSDGPAGPGSSSIGGTSEETEEPFVFSVEAIDEERKRNNRRSP